MLEEFDVLPLAESHLEQAYRNNVNEAFSQGMEQVLDHPLVEDAFPYRRYVRIRNARCRKEHAELEKLGLDGTAVAAQPAIEYGAEERFGRQRR